MQLTVHFAALCRQAMVVGFAYVAVKVAGLGVAAIAVAALERALARVHDGVAPQGVGAGEGLPTRGTGGHVLHVGAQGILEVLEVHRLRIGRLGGVLVVPGREEGGGER